MDPDVPTVTLDIGLVGLWGGIGVSRQSVADKPRLRIFALEWLDPFAARHWVPEMIALAGGKEVLGRAGENRFA